MSPPSPLPLPPSSPLPSQQAEPWEEEQPGGDHSLRLTMFSELCFAFGLVWFKEKEEPGGDHHILV